jgi:hypothetical protein
VLEQDRKRNFERAVVARFQRRFGVHSPYLYEMDRHREVALAAFEREVREREAREMRSRYAAMMSYKSAVQSALEHDKKLVKKDKLHRIQPSLRIRVLNTE